MVWCWLFIIKMEYGILGCGFAMALTCIIEFISVTILAHSVERIQPALFWPNRESFNGWGEYFAVSIPATVMICAEWWSFELFVIASSYIDINYLAANVILQNLCTTMFMFPLGLQEGICSLVGSSIGANNVAQGKKIFVLTSTISYCFCMLCAMILFFFRGSVATLFTNDEAVIEILVATVPLVALSFCVDSMQGILQGTVRALGIQSRVFIWVIGSFYLVGWPFGMYLGFKKDFKIKGFWMGTMTALTS